MADLANVFHARSYGCRCVGVADESADEALVFYAQRKKRGQAPYGRERKQTFLFLLLV